MALQRITLTRSILMFDYDKTTVTLLKVDVDYSKDELRSFEVMVEFDQRRFLITPQSEDRALLAGRSSQETTQIEIVQLASALEAWANARGQLRPRPRQST